MNSSIFNNYYSFPLDARYLFYWLYKLLLFMVPVVVRAIFPLDKIFDGLFTCRAKYATMKTLVEFIHFKQRYSEFKGIGDVRRRCCSV